MTGIIAALAVLGAALWLMGRPGRRRPAPEDDVTSPIDRDELEAAERELDDDPSPRPLDGDDEDDWGPGAA